ncbi:DUF6141 family protein [Terrimonas pollutisoli]|uniref:DUF6141 family protein n=1 Tax=Terrimonas pollutisoli TaxID=3034147 RepID=UPI0023ED9815|nr:DUF6141 family protein [Terrimonas sp. H1YJ31]
MSTEILFEEIQGSDRKKTRSFFKVMAGIFILALLFNFFIQKGSFGDIAASLLVGLLICIVVIIFSDLRLITQIRTDGIYVRFTPFEQSFKKYSWDSIQEVFVSKFNPATIGIGIRFGPRGKAYIFSGDTGLQIIFTNGERLLIGTRHPDEMKSVLSKLGRG